MNVNNNNQNAGVDPSVNSVELSDNAAQYDDDEPIQLCFLGSENSGKQLAQLYLLQQNGHDAGFDSTGEASFDIEASNPLGNYVMSLQAVPVAFQALADVLVRESDVFIIMYNR